MAIESQGIQIRRISTVAGSSAQNTTAAGLVTFDSTLKTITRAAGDWSTAGGGDGFTVGMRLETNSTANNNVYTISTLSSVTITVYEPLTATASTAFIITGHEFQVIGDITGFSGPTGSAAVIDITTLGSTAKEKMIGIRDEGQITLDLNYNSSADQLHPALRTDRANRTKRIFDIKFTDETTAAGSQPSAAYFDAYVTNFGLTGAVDNVVKASITLELTSAVRWIARV